MTDSFPITGFCGTIRTQVPLDRLTTWRIGGPARWLVRPANSQALSQLMTGLPHNIPQFWLGGGSNILVADEGFSGVVVDLKGRLNKIELAEKNSIIVAAGATTRATAHFARRHGLSGAEFLGGIPGTIGGALVMNAGAYGSAMNNIVSSATLIDKNGISVKFTTQQLGLEYRKSDLPTGSVVTEVRLNLSPDDPLAIKKRMSEINLKRRNSQPLKFYSAGSTFKNPPQGPAAWRLIADAGMRGARVGAAEVSEQHCNFFLNRGRATAEDMRALIRLVQQRVLESCGTKLKTEVLLMAPNGIRGEEDSG